jgi:hypothetical protein
MSQNHFAANPQVGIAGSIFASRPFPAPIADKDLVDEPREHVRRHLSSWEWPFT